MFHAKRFKLNRQSSFLKMSFLNFPQHKEQEYHIKDSVPNKNTSEISSKDKLHTAVDRSKRPLLQQSNQPIVFEKGMQGCHHRRYLLVFSRNESKTNILKTITGLSFKTCSMIYRREWLTVQTNRNKRCTKSWGTSFQPATLLMPLSSAGK